jgi:GNAT superfamily N-acetyltransferase
MIEIKSIHKDCYSGQHDYSLIATVDGDFAGSLDYSIYQGRAAVRDISVLQSKRRQGVGTALLVALQETYPDQAIMFGYTTADGTALLNSLEWRSEVNQVVADAAEEIATLTQKLRGYERRAEEVSKLPQSVRGDAVKEFDDWNEVTDRVEELEHVMNTQPAQFRYIVSPENPEPVPGL